MTKQEMLQQIVRAHERQERAFRDIVEAAKPNYSFWNRSNGRSLNLRAATLSSTSKQ